MNKYLKGDLVGRFPALSNVREDDTFKVVAHFDKLDRALGTNMWCQRLVNILTTSYLPPLSEQERICRALAYLEPEVEKIKEQQK